MIIQQNMVAHIRYATQGEVSLENVHPFVRVWKGVQMVFCHNGDCPTFSNTLEVPLLGNTTRGDIQYHPVGDTDSEAVFCAILNALSVEFQDGLPTLPVLHEFLSNICDEITERDPETIFNFLLGCGQYTLFAYSWPGQRPGSKVWNGLHYIVRQPPFQTAKLLDTDYEIDFAAVTTPADRVAVITTKPLTEEPGWTECQRGELLMFDKGLPYRTPKCCETVELQGRGLFSKAVTAKCNRSPSLRSCRRQYQQQQQSPAKREQSPPPLSLPHSTVAAATAVCVTGDHPQRLPPLTTSASSKATAAKAASVANAKDCVRLLSQVVQQTETAASSVPVKMATSAGVIAATSNDDTSLVATQSLQRVAIQ